MEMFPPHGGCPLIQLALTEVVASSWRTMRIQTDINPKPVALALKKRNDESGGTWVVVSGPDSDTIIRQGQASPAVCS